VVGMSEFLKPTKGKVSLTIILFILYLFLYISIQLFLAPCMPLQDYQRVARSNFGGLGPSFTKICPEIHLNPLVILVFHTMFFYISACGIVALFEIIKKNKRPKAEIRGSKK
jgi:hypothetical protein